MKKVLLFSVLFILFPVIAAGFLWYWIVLGFDFGTKVAEIYDNWLNKDSK